MLFASQSPPPVAVLACDRLHNGSTFAQYVCADGTHDMQKSHDRFAAFAPTGVRSMLEPTWMRLYISPQLLS